MQVSLAQAAVQSIYNFIEQNGYVFDFATRMVPELRYGDPLFDQDEFDLARNGAREAMGRNFEFLTDWLAYWLARGGGRDVCRGDFGVYMQAVALVMADAADPSFSHLSGRFSAVMPPNTVSGAITRFGRGDDRYAVPNALSPEFFLACSKLETERDYIYAHEAMCNGDASRRYTGGPWSSIGGQLPFSLWPDE